MGVQKQKERRQNASFQEELSSMSINTSQLNENCVARVVQEGLAIFRKRKMLESTLLHKG